MPHEELSQKMREYQFQPLKHDAMIEGSLEGRYAKVFYDVFLKKNEDFKEKIPSILKAGHNFLHTLERAPPLKEALTSPVIPFSRRIRVLEGLGHMLELPKILMDFLSIVLKKRRLNHFAGIWQNLEIFSQQDTGHINGVLYVAHEISKTASHDIHQWLKKMSKKSQTYAAKQRAISIHLQVKIEPALLGGYCIKMPGYVFDASFKHHLNRMKHNVAKGL